MHSTPAPRCRGGLPGYTLPSNQNLKNKDIFCIHDDVKPFMSFTIHAKSATVNRLKTSALLKNKIKNVGSLRYIFKKIKKIRLRDLN